MPRYRNRPDRRVVRETPIQIQPVADYSAAFEGTTKVRCTFSTPMMIAGSVVARLTNDAGAIIGGTPTVAQLSPTLIELTFTGTINAASRVFFFQQNQTTLRSTTGAIVSAAPRFILAA
jgi:hypothetical protein